MGARPPGRAICADDDPGAYLPPAPHRHHDATIPRLPDLRAPPDLPDGRGRRRRLTDRRGRLHLVAVRSIWSGYWSGYFAQTGDVDSGPQARTGGAGRVHQRPVELRAHHH